MWWIWRLQRDPPVIMRVGAKSDCSIINILDARASLVLALSITSEFWGVMNIQIWPVAAFVHWLLFVQIFVIPCVRFWYGYNCECEDPTRGECNIVQQWMVLATNSFYLAIDLHMILVNTILFIHLQGVSKRVHRILLSSRHLACFNENNSENISIQFFCFSWAFLAQSERL